MTLKMQALRRGLTTAGVLLGLVGCAGQQLSADGMKLIQEGQTEKGLAMLARASEMEPTNSQLRVDYLKYQLLTVREWLRRGDEARAAGQPAVAREMYLATLRIDPSNYRARRGLEALDTDERHRALVVEANKLHEWRRPRRGARQAAAGAAGEPVTAGGAATAGAGQRTHGTRRGSTDRRARHRCSRSRSRCSSVTRTSAWCSKRCRARPDSTSSSTVTCVPT